jgi:hypothetical protein
MADGACVCWGVVWFLLLWFIGWPIAGFCAGFYILLLPLTVCIEGLKVSLHYSKLKVFFMEFKKN